MIFSLTGEKAYVGILRVCHFGQSHFGQTQIGQTRFKVKKSSKNSIYK